MCGEDSRGPGLNVSGLRSSCVCAGRRTSGRESQLAGGRGGLGKVELHDGNRVVGSGAVLDSNVIRSSLVLGNTGLDGGGVLNKSPDVTRVESDGKTSLSRSLGFSIDRTEHIIIFELLRGDVCAPARANTVRVHVISGQRALEQPQLGLRLLSAELLSSLLVDLLSITDSVNILRDGGTTEHANEFSVTGVGGWYLEVTGEGDRGKEGQEY